MIITANAYALSLAAAGTGNLPVLGWHNLLEAGTLSADQEDPFYPVSNLATSATNELWKSGSTDVQYITLLFGDETQVDYAGVAGHNWGTGNIPVTVQGLAAGGDPEDPADWIELVASAVPANDWALLFRFDPTYLIGVRLKLEPVSAEPQAAVLYVGKLLVFEKGVQPGHTPLPYGRRREVLTPMSQSGQFLGRVTSGGNLQTAASIIKLTPSWYRSTLEPFAAVCMEAPFFWAWRPTQYPAEVGYAWLTSDIVPVPSEYAGYIDIQLQMEGLL